MFVSEEKSQCVFASDGDLASINGGFVPLFGGIIIDWKLIAGLVGIAASNYANRP